MTLPEQNPNWNSKSYPPMRALLRSRKHFGFRLDTASLARQR